jgi:hypothetical protein
MSKKPTETQPPPIIINDVCPPLILFKHFLDDFLCNKGFEPMTEDELSCMEAGNIALRNALTDLHKVHNYIDELERAQRGGSAR